MRFYQNIFVGFVIGICFFQIKVDQDGIINIFGVLFFMIMSCTYSNLASVTFTPQFLISPFFLIMVGYWMAGLRPDALRFLYTYGILALVSMAAVSYGYVIATLSPSSSIATALGPPLAIPLLITGGFYIQTASIPEWLTWLPYVSWFSYGYEALVLIQWGNYGNITCSTANDTNDRCLNNGTDVIESRGFNQDNLTIDIYGLLALIVGFRLISYLFLLRSAYKRP